MSISRSYLFSALMQHNYFPNQRYEEHFPPSFSSYSLKDDIAHRLNSLDNRRGGYDSVVYRETRYNQTTRKLSIPHPVAHAKLTSTIVEHWHEIEKLCDSPNSQLKPRQYDGGRIMIMDYWGDASEPSLTGEFPSFGANFIVHADVAQCFSSIGTQAIVQATLDGTSTGSSRKTPPQWLVELEKRLKATQAGNDSGLLIGPASSNIFSEIVLGQVDRGLRSWFRFERHIDDFTCYCDSHEEALLFMRKLKDELGRYGLELNQNKYRITECPAPADPEWIIKLRLAMPTDGSFISARRYLDYALMLSKEYPDASALKFAVKSVIYKLDDDAKPSILVYILNLCRWYPHLLSSLYWLVAHPSVEKAIHLTPYLNRVLQDNAVAKRSDGMCWALYYLERLKLPVERPVAELIIDSGDSLAITLLRRFDQKYRDMVLSWFHHYQGQASQQMLDQYWLLAYGIFRSGEYEYLHKIDPCFEVLAEGGVRFGRAA